MKSCIEAVISNSNQLFEAIRNIINVSGSNEERNLIKINIMKLKLSMI